MSKFDNSDSDRSVWSKSRTETIIYGSKSYDFDWNYEQLILNNICPYSNSKGGVGSELTSNIFAYTSMSDDSDWNSEQWTMNVQQFMPDSNSNKGIWSELITKIICLVKFWRFWSTCNRNRIQTGASDPSRWQKLYFRSKFDRCCLPVPNSDFTEGIWSEPVTVPRCPVNI